MADDHGATGAAGVEATDLIVALVLGKVYVPDVLRRDSCCNADAAEIAAANSILGVFTGLISVRSQGRTRFGLEATASVISFLGREDGG